MSDAKVSCSKIYPTVEELELMCTSVRCTQADCSAVFQSSSNLNMHLIKHHKIDSDKLTKRLGKCEYYCPVKPCAYHEDSKKYFSKLKYLKQHYFKVHAAKKFDCKSCSKKFGTETLRNLHVRECGKSFTCTCGAIYNSSEAILTHCKRKGGTHSRLKVASQNKADLGSTKSTDDVQVKRNERIIYPKLMNDTMSFPIHYIAAIALSELSTPCNLSRANDIGIQTDHLLLYQSHGIKKNVCSIKGDNKKRKNSQQTQTVTNKHKKLKISTETQTSGDYLKTKQKQKCTLRKRKQSMETQTKEQVKLIATTFENVNEIFNESNNIQNDQDKSWFCNDHKSLGPLEEFTSSKYKSLKSSEFTRKEIGNDYNNLCKNNDVCISSRGAICNIETQTEMDSFLTECSDDTSFTLCSSTETQTTDDFDSLLYSNMCTQTSEEVDELFNFNFVDIETQTAWPDLSELKP